MLARASTKTFVSRGITVFIYPSPFHVSYLFLPYLLTYFVSCSLSKCSPFFSSLTSFLLNSLSSTVLSLSSSVLSFAVHAFRTVSWFIFFFFRCSLCFHCLFVCLLQYGAHQTKYVAFAGNAPTSPAFCVVIGYVTFGQWPVTEHVSLASSECWVCYRNVSKTLVRGRPFLAADGAVLVILVRSAVRVSSKNCCDIV